MSRPRKIAPVTGSEPVAVEEAIFSPSARIEQMNEYAARVWDGQSVSLPTKERHKRVTKALEGQGYTPDEISLVIVG